MQLRASAWLRLNQKSIGDDRYMLVSTVLMCVGSVAAGVWALRHQMPEVLPRKRRLEGLLKELDGR